MAIHGPSFEIVTKTGMQEWITGMDNPSIDFSANPLFASNLQSPTESSAHLIIIHLTAIMVNASLMKTCIPSLIKYIA